MRFFQGFILHSSEILPDVSFEIPEILKFQLGFLQELFVRLFQVRFQGFLLRFCFAFLSEITPVISSGILPENNSEIPLQVYCRAPFGTSSVIPAVPFLKKCFLEFLEESLEKV